MSLVPCRACGHQVDTSALGRVRSNRRDCVCRRGMGVKARGEGNGRSIPKPSNAGDRPRRQTRRAMAWRGALLRCRSLVQIAARRERRLALPPRHAIAQPVAYCEHALPCPGCGATNPGRKMSKQQSDLIVLLIQLILGFALLAGGLTVAWNVVGPILKTQLTKPPN